MSHLTEEPRMGSTFQKWKPGPSQGLNIAISEAVIEKANQRLQTPAVSFNIWREWDAAACFNCVFHCRGWNYV